MSRRNKNQNKLMVYWNKYERDLVIDHPLGVGAGADAHYLHTFFNGNLIRELNERGYDVSSLKFEVTVNPKLRPDRFPTLLKEMEEKEAQP